MRVAEVYKTKRLPTGLVTVLFGQTRRNVSQKLNLEASSEPCALMTLQVRAAASDGHARVVPEGVASVGGHLLQVQRQPAQQLVRRQRGLRVTGGCAGQD